MLVGVINVQHRAPHAYTQREIQLISTIGFLVGPEIELARLEAESSRSSELSEALETVERAKAVLGRELQLSAGDAAAMLQRESRQRRKSMKEVSDAILLADEILGAPRASRPS
jgi:uroporphyrinogen-III synthase